MGREYWPGLSELVSLRPLYKPRRLPLPVAGLPYLGDHDTAYLSYWWAPSPDQFY
jgi:hypothetical protein